MGADRVLSASTWRSARAHGRIASQGGAAPIVSLFLDITSFSVLEQ